MKVSDYIIEFLAEKGVHHIFYMIGGAITHLVDSTIDNEKLSGITLHHEQAAAFAAEGYARCNANLGVAMATSGPGATNLVTGIGSCFFDSVPCLFITGQVNTYEYKFKQPVRQIGFQETDIVSIVKPITKGARLVENASDIRRDLEWAVYTAQSGRLGPVLLDIPMNIQRAEINPNELEPYFINSEKSTFSNEIIESILTKLYHAQRPIILVGGGVRIANACDELLEFVTKTGIPVVSSLMGLDGFPHNNPSFVGMLGTYGRRGANFAVANSDFLLILGSRLDTRQTGTKPTTFARAAVVIHVDIDENELNRSIKSDFAIKMDLKIFLKVLNQKIKAKDIIKTALWLDYISKCKTKFPLFLSTNKGKEINPNEFIYFLSHHVDDNAIITVDVGQHQMWVAQSFEIKPHQRLLISGGMGAMGFALPVAIGAAFLDPHRQIIVIVGDGGMQINIQELQTIIRNGLNIKIVVLNNKCLGMVRQFQEIYFRNRTEGTLIGYDCPDFTKIAESYNIPAIRLENNNDMDVKLKAFLQKRQSCLLEVMLENNTQVDPKLMVAEPIENQAPNLSEDEFAKMMLIEPISK